MRVFVDVLDVWDVGYGFQKGDDGSMHEGIFANSRYDGPAIWIGASGNTLVGDFHGDNYHAVATFAFAQCFSTVLSFFVIVLVIAISLVC